MNFFGIEISDSDFEAAMVLARAGQSDAAIALALGFEPTPEMLASIKDKAESDLRGSGG